MTTEALTIRSTQAAAMLRGGVPPLAAVPAGFCRPRVDPTSRPMPNAAPTQASVPNPWDAFDALDDALALHDRPGRQVFANTALHRLAETGDGLQRAPGGAVLPTDPGALRMLQRALAAAAAGTPMELAVPRRSGAAPYLVRCSPVPGRSGWTVLRVADSSARRAPSTSFLRSAFGLTKAEAMLAIGLCRGASLADYATERGISVHTVRTQLRALLGKTRTERQADLVGLLSGMSF
jgi:DNA-binding CsgD family transcriptional regulator